MTDSPALDVNDEFTPEVDAALRTLRDAGFAAAAFTPSELQGVDPDRIEELMVERGFEAIDTLRNPYPLPPCSICGYDFTDKED